MYEHTDDRSVHQVRINKWALFDCSRTQSIIVDRPDNSRQRHLSLFLSSPVPNKDLTLAYKYSFSRGCARATDHYDNRSLAPLSLSLSRFRQTIDDQIKLIYACNWAPRSEMSYGLLSLNRCKFTPGLSMPFFILLSRLTFAAALAV